MRSFAIMTLAFAALFGWVVGSVPIRKAVPPQPAAAAPLAPAPVVVAAIDRSTPGTLTIDRGANGHFTVPGEIGGLALRFVVDTGATEVALSRQDARAAGIDVDALAFDHEAQTAGGMVRTAEVRLPEVRVGDIRASDVPAVVLDVPDAVMPLLGQSFLARIDKVSIEGDRMTLTKL